MESYTHSLHEQLRVATDSTRALGVLRAWLDDQCRLGVTAGSGGIDVVDRIAGVLKESESRVVRKLCYQTVRGHVKTPTDVERLARIIAYDLQPSAANSAAADAHPQDTDVLLHVFRFMLALPFPLLEILLLGPDIRGTGPLLALVRRFGTHPDHDLRKSALDVIGVLWAGECQGRSSASGQIPGGYVGFFFDVVTARLSDNVPVVLCAALRCLSAFLCVDLVAAQARSLMSSSSSSSASSASSSASSFSSSSGSSPSSASLSNSDSVQSARRCLLQNVQFDDAHLTVLITWIRDHISDLIQRFSYCESELVAGHVFIVSLLVDLFVTDQVHRVAGHTPASMSLLVHERLPSKLYLVDDYVNNILMRFLIDSDLGVRADVGKCVVYLHDRYRPEHADWIMHVMQAWLPIVDALSYTHQLDDLLTLICTHLTDIHEELLYGVAVRTLPRLDRVVDPSARHCCLMLLLGNLVSCSIESRRKRLLFESSSAAAAAAISGGSGGVGGGSGGGVKGTAMGGAGGHLLSRRPGSASSFHFSLPSIGSLFVGSSGGSSTGSGGGSGGGSARAGQRQSGGPIGSGSLSGSQLDVTVAMDPLETLFNEGFFSTLWSSGSLRYEMLGLLIISLLNQCPPLRTAHSVRVAAENGDGSQNPPTSASGDPSMALPSSDDHEPEIAMQSWVIVAMGTAFVARQSLMWPVIDRQGSHSRSFLQLVARLCAIVFRYYSEDDGIAAAGGGRSLLLSDSPWHLFRRNMVELLAFLTTQIAILQTESAQIQALSIVVHYHELGNTNEVLTEKLLRFLKRCILLSFAQTPTNQLLMFVSGGSSSSSNSATPSGGSLQRNLSLQGVPQRIPSIGGDGGASAGGSGGGPTDLDDVFGFGSGSGGGDMRRTPSVASGMDSGSERGSGLPRVSSTASLGGGSGGSNASSGPRVGSVGATVVAPSGSSASSVGSSLGAFGSFGATGTVGTFRPLSAQILLDLLVLLAWKQERLYRDIREFVELRLAPLWQTQAHTDRRAWSLVSTTQSKLLLIARCRESMLESSASGSSISSSGIFSSMSSPSTMMSQIMSASSSHSLFPGSQQARSASKPSGNGLGAHFPCSPFLYAVQDSVVLDRTHPVFDVFLNESEVAAIADLEYSQTLAGQVDFNKFSVYIFGGFNNYLYRTQDRRRRVVYADILDFNAAQASVALRNSDLGSSNSTGDSGRRASNVGGATAGEFSLDFGTPSKSGGSPMLGPISGPDDSNRSGLALQSVGDSSGARLFQFLSGSSDICFIEGRFVRTDPDVQSSFLTAHFRICNNAPIDIEQLSLSIHVFGPMQVMDSDELEERIFPVVPAHGVVEYFVDFALSGWEFNAVSLTATAEVIDRNVRKRVSLQSRGLLAVELKDILQAVTLEDASEFNLLWTSMTRIYVAECKLVANDAIAARDIVDAATNPDVFFSVSKEFCHVNHVFSMSYSSRSWFNDILLLTVYGTSRPSSSGTEWICKFEFRSSNASMIEYVKSAFPRACQAAGKALIPISDARDFLPGEDVFAQIRTTQFDVHTEPTLSAVTSDCLRVWKNLVPIVDEVSSSQVPQPLVEEPSTLITSLLPSTSGAILQLAGGFGGAPPSFAPNFDSSVPQPYQLAPATNSIFPGDLTSSTASGSAGGSSTNSIAFPFGSDPASSSSLPAPSSGDVFSFGSPVPIPVPSDIAPPPSGVLPPPSFISSAMVAQTILADHPGSHEPRRERLSMAPGSLSAASAAGVGSASAGAAGTGPGAAGGAPVGLQSPNPTGRPRIRPSLGGHHQRMTSVDFFDQLSR